MNTHCVALTSIEMGTLGPLRMSALIHTGLRTLPSSVSRRRRSSEGPTALRLLKSSLIPVGRAQGLGEMDPHAQGRRNQQTRLPGTERAVGLGAGGGQTGTRLQLGVKRAFKQAKLPTEEGPAPAPAPAPGGRKLRPAKGSDRGCQASEKKRLWFLDRVGLEHPKPT